MKFPNYLISSLAIVGAFSLIIMACSVNDSNSATTTTNSVGKYQITSTSIAGGNNSTIYHFDVIDTETGIVKSYYSTNLSQSYQLYKTTITQ